MAESRHIITSRPQYSSASARSLLSLAGQAAMFENATVFQASEDTLLLIGKKSWGGKTIFLLPVLGSLPRSLYIRPIKDRLTRNTKFMNMCMGAPSDG